jgi:DNA-binding MarR family transcriptional regulator
MADDSTPDACRPDAVAGHARSLDPVVHERIRLAILCVLSRVQGLAFTDLRDLLQLTDGNLSVHARRLEEAAYIASTKETEHRSTRTRFRLTAAGRKALEQHLERLEALIATVRR